GLPNLHRMNIRGFAEGGEVPERDAKGRFTGRFIPYGATSPTSGFSTPNLATSPNDSQAHQFKVDKFEVKSLIIPSGAIGSNQSLSVPLSQTSFNQTPYNLRPFDKNAEQLTNLQSFYPTHLIPGSGYSLSPSEVAAKKYSSPALTFKLKEEQKQFIPKDNYAGLRGLL